MLEISELLGETRQLLTEVQWEWQANDGEWREYAPTENRMIEVWLFVAKISTEPRPLSLFKAGYVAHEEEIGIAVLGRPYTVDLMAMRQVKIMIVVVISYHNGCSSMRTLVTHDMSGVLLELLNNR